MFDIYSRQQAKFAGALPVGKVKHLAPFYPDFIHASPLHNRPPKNKAANRLEYVNWVFIKTEKKPSGYFTGGPGYPDA
jgi:hypothetical protein